MQCPNCSFNNAEENIFYEVRHHNKLNSTRFFKKVNFYCPKCKLNKDREIEINPAEYHQGLRKK